MDELRPAFVEYVRLQRVHDAMTDDTIHFALLGDDDAEEPLFLTVRARSSSEAMNDADP
jgi:hypothetical protein